MKIVNGWGALIDLRSAISDKVHGIEARLLPDGKTLYFSNSVSPSGENDARTRTTRVGDRLDSSACDASLTQAGVHRPLR